MENLELCEESKRLYEESRKLYQEVSLVHFCFYKYILKCDLSDHTLTIFKIVPYLYLCLQKALELVQRSITLNSDDYMCWLQQSVIYYDLGKIKPALLSFRRALSLRNKKDSLYNRTFSQRKTLYKKIIFQLNRQDIREDILNPKFFEQIREKKISKTLDQLVNELLDLQCSDKGNLEKSIEILEKIKSKKKKGETKALLGIYTSALDKINDLIDSCEQTHYNLLYMKGYFCLEISLLNNESIDWKNIYNIYRKGFTTNTFSINESSNKIKKYTNSIIGLINTPDEEVVKYRFAIGETAIRDIKSINPDDGNNEIRKAIYIALGDLYMEIEEYVAAIKSYLDAVDIESQKKMLSSFSAKFYLPMKYAKRLKKIFNKVSIEESKKIFYQVLDHKDFASKDQYYSHIWFRIGKSFHYYKDENNAEKNNFIQRHEMAIASYTEAFEKTWFFLETSALNNVNIDGFLAIILVEKGKAYKKIGRNSDSRKALQEALRIDQNLKAYLKPHYYRTVLRNLLEINFILDHKRSGTIQKLFLAADSLDSIYFYFEDLKDKTKRQSAPNDKSAKDRVKKYCFRIAESYYAKGNFLLQQAKRNSSWKRTDLFKKRLQCYEKALEALNEGSGKSKNLPPDVQYFKLEIISDLLEVNLELGNYESNHEYLLLGSQLLESLVREKDEGKLKQKYKYIQRKKLEEKFLIIEDFRLSFFDRDFKKSLTHAEMRKNVCLTNLLRDRENSGGVESLSYESIRENLLMPDTAIVYWYMRVDEITTLVLVPDKTEPISISRYTGRIEYFEKHAKYREFKAYMDRWDWLPGEESLDNQLTQFKRCLKDFYEVLEIEKILEMLSKEKNVKKIILIPHRDLHRVPLHIFFSGFYDEHHLEQPTYIVSYLPSIRIGLQLDSTLMPGTSLLSIRPSSKNRKNHPFFTEAESTAIYLKSYCALSKPPTKLEGKPDSEKSEVKKRLKNDISFSYLHFLGHAYHDLEKPRNSALQLTDEKLTLADMNKLDFSNYYLVCLSACETGITSPSRPLDEYIGLVSAFLAKGVSYVVSTLWRIEDTPACLLMIEFYRMLFEEEEHPVIALKEAQRWLRESNRGTLQVWCEKQSSDLCEILERLSLTENEKSEFQNSIDLIETFHYTLENSKDDLPYKNPYYWAGFIITGIPDFDL